MTDQEIELLRENNEFNYNVLNIILTYLLENDLLVSDDIDDKDDSAAGAAQTYINVYERLRNS